VGHVELLIELHVQGLGPVRTPSKEMKNTATAKVKQ
jgi:hypothetical protein